MEKTWQEIGSITDLDEAEALSLNFSAKQPAVAQFILEFTKEMRPEARELGFYIGIMIWIFFDRKFSTRCREVTPEELIKSNEGLDSNQA